jgi:type IV secretion system protein VirB3
VNAPRQSLTEDILFLACTRPAMVFGAPMEAVGVTLIVSALAFLAAGSLLYLLVAPSLHLVCRAICANDANAFRVLYLGLAARAKVGGTGLWGGSSPDPLAVHSQLARRARG